ncbi:MAG TPA: FmdB family zinc ribbon protein [Gemmatimonadales bacterium]|jgi:putative FmdB family regulatory protein
MPTYEYRCDNGHAFERVQKMSDKPITRCPVCGARAARVISGGQGVIFKGSGFYITDYGKDGKGPRKAPEGGASGEEKSAPKSDATSPKPAADSSSATKSNTKPPAKPGKADPA